MNESLRQKKVASLIKETLSRLLQQEFSSAENGLISITRIDLSKDLRSADVFLSFYGGPASDEVISVLNKRAGYFRKAVASRIKLKYNPQFIFFEDPFSRQEEFIDNLLKKNK